MPKAANDRQSAQLISTRMEANGSEWKRMACSLDHSSRRMPDSFDSFHSWFRFFSMRREGMNFNADEHGFPQIRFASADGAKRRSMPKAANDRQLAQFISTRMEANDRECLRMACSSDPQLSSQRRIRSIRFIRGSDFFRCIEQE